MTLALAACAFVLSFDALRGLAVTLGVPKSIACLWPCAIDVAIAQAILCLLSLSRRPTKTHRRRLPRALRHVRRPTTRLSQDSVDHQRRGKFCVGGQPTGGEVTTASASSTSFTACCEAGCATP
jgi:hypothetical protein